MEANLRLFGPIGWSLNGRHIPVGGSTRVGVVLQLAEAQGATVSVDSLLTNVWTTVPRSGANAVQRHISALRRQLKELGVAEPEDVIHRVNGGYRLTAATSDLTRLERLLDGTADEIEAVHWWEEPLVGAPWEPTQVLRARLERLAEQALTRWSETRRPEVQDAVGARAEQMSRHTPGCREAHRIKARVDRRARHADRQMLTEAGQTTLRETIGLWAAGQGSDGLDLLEARKATLPGDFVRRLNRCLIWFDHDDTGRRHNLAALVEDARASPVQHERCLVALDANALEEHPDGRDLAHAEIAAAESLWDQVRALRVGFLVGLSLPHTKASDELVEQLDAIQHPDAQVEAARFRFLAQLRLGNLDDAKCLLDAYAAAVDRLWIGSGDDFAAMATTALQRSSDAGVAETFGPMRPRIGGYAADRWTVPVAETVRQLIQTEPGATTVTNDNYVGAVSTCSATARTALNLLQDHYRGQSVIHKARVLAAALPTITREKQFVMAPIALCVLAEALRDPGLASAAADAIEPWSGQTLGLWPVDYCFGPANDWLDRLAAVS